MDHSLTLSESARTWGALWGARPRAWAANEEQQTPVYQQALHYVELWPGDRVLDVGCGTGVFLRMCADRGASVVGVDAAEGMLEVARSRIPEGEFHHADLQALPFATDEFDLVTGFASFFFADDMVAALREARRVARPGAAVVIEAWGRPEHCDLEAMKQAVAVFRGESAETYWRPGVVEELATQADLTVERAFDSTWAYEFANDEALLEAMLAAGGAGVVAGEREPELRAALLEALAACRQLGGSYRLSNEWHVVIARA
jgi:SAM-dependent methyltransferase